MIQDFIQSSMFWPITLALILGYYAWVGYSFFRESLLILFKGTQSAKGTTKKVTLSWDDLTCGFAIHRKLMFDPKANLEPYENELLAKSPFKELIRGTYGN